MTPRAAAASPAVPGPRELGDELAAKLRPYKPALRGWLHAGLFPLALAGGIVMICLSPSAGARLAAVAYMVGACLLFGTSSVYHRFSPWSPRAEAVMRRLDHANIFMLIAGTYTPFSLLLHGGDKIALLVGVWGGAALGMGFRLFWLGAPRWLYTPIYLAVGWLAVFWMGDFWRTAGPTMVWLMVAGGLCYTLGAIVYATKRPDPSPRWFGFHEIFHAFTVVGFVLQYIAASIVVYRFG